LFKVRAAKIIKHPLSIPFAVVIAHFPPYQYGTAGDEVGFVSCITTTSEDMDETIVYSISIIDK
jgi:hypothetical protein